MPEDIISWVIISAIVLIIIYLIFQRIKEKEKEDFEDRDN